ncbi:MAG: hypothetical protein JOZ82_09125, partial [Marmoricola sp.]|nr:hypothetical protein [Marmoricola sp.]
MSTTVDELTPGSTQVDSGEELRAMETIRRGLAYSPELGEGFKVTVLLAVLGTAGRLVVPIAVQQTVDKGLQGPHGVDLAFVGRMTAVAAVAIAVTAVSSF